MAIAIIDGAEGGANATSGYLLRDPNPETTTPRPRTAGRVAGDRAYRPTNAANTTISVRRFLWNADENRPLRLREAYLGVAYWQDENTITNNTLNQYNQLGFAKTGVSRALGFYCTGGETRFRRGNVDLTSARVGTGIRGVSNSFWFCAFSRDSNGWAYLTNGQGTKEYLRFDGDTNFGTTDPWFDAIYFSRRDNLSSFDDMTVIAPSVSVTLQGQPTLSMDDDVVGTLSGASAKVSDFEPSKGRIWLHSWNNQPWQDGEPLEDGLGNPIGTLNAPDAAFVNGFEPWSYPQWNQRGVPYVLITSPQQDIAPTDLTPVGNPNNVDNINAVPEDPATYNENTATGALSDTYGGYAALPAWVDTVVAVEPEGFVEDVLDGDDVTLTLTDPTGSQSTISAFTTAAPRVPFPEALRADGSAWTPADIPNITVTFTLRNL